MPWHIERRDDEYCVIKDADNSVAGCHASRDEAADQIRALYASEEDEKEASLSDVLSAIAEIAQSLKPTEVSPEPQEIITTDIEVPEAQHTPWAGVLTLEGVETGDGRLFKEGAVTWKDELLPVPFTWQRSSAPGHDGNVTIGRVDSIFRSEDGRIRGTGVILTGLAEDSDTKKYALEYVELAKSGAAGWVSIDGDSAEFELLDSPDGDPFKMKQHFTSINIRSLCAVSISAFDEAKIQLVDGVVAAVIGSTNLPVASRDMNYDGLAAQRGIFEWAKSGEGYDIGKLARAFLWRDSDGDPNEKGSYKLPFTQVIDGTLTIVPKAVFAAAAAVEGARGGVKVPDSDKAGIRRKIGTLYSKIEPVEGEDGHPRPPWESDAGDASLLDVSEFSRDMDDRLLEEPVTASIPVDPPLEWFEKPHFDQLTPITITDDGRVFGHLCGKDTCHIGFGSCKNSPRNCDYDEYFHLGCVKTSDGVEVNVGHMTFGGGHAPLDQNAQTAASYYDSTSRVSADIRCGEDEFGTWVAGALRPSLSGEDIREIRSAPLSGDWRPIKGKLQLIAAHAVNVPGFPISRAKVLVASGITEAIILTEECDCNLEEEFQSLLFELELEDTSEK